MSKCNADILLTEKKSRQGIFVNNDVNFTE